MPGQPSTTAPPSTTASPVVELGWRLYYDRGLSGGFSSKDNLGRNATQATATRACDGERVDVSCADCHDPQRYGSDCTSVPPNVSNGAGWYDASTANRPSTSPTSEKHHQYYWNGRTDSLWSQAAQVIASGVSMNGSIDNTFKLLSENTRRSMPRPSASPRPRSHPFACT